MFLCVILAGTSAIAQTELVNGADFDGLLRARIKNELIGDGEPQGLRAFADELRSLHGIAIFLDRRVDPDAPLRLELPEMRLEFMLREAAGKQSMGVVLRDGLVYLGPRKLCRWWPGELDSLSRLVSKLPESARKYWQQESPLGWEEGDTPKEIVGQIAGDKLAAAEAQKLPHDVWAEIAGPRMPRWEQLALVCAGFDLIPEIASDGMASLRAVKEGKLQSSVVSVAPAMASELMQGVSRYFPEAKLTPRQGKLTIEGSVGEIRAIQAWAAAPKKPPKSKAGESVMALSTPLPTPARELLGALAKQAKAELVVERGVSAEELATPIKPAWKGTLPQLLEKISEASGLSCTLRDGKIIVAKP